LFAAGAQAADYYVFGVSNMQTSSGAQWSTELSIANQGSAALLTFSLLTTADQVAPAPETKTVAPGQTLVLHDVIAELWGMSGRSGVLKVTTDQPVLITAAKSAPGRYGTRLPVIGEQRALSAGQIGDSLWIQQDSSASTSISLALETADAAVDLILFDANGAKLTTVTLSGGPQVINTEVAALTTSDLPLGRAEVRVRSGRAAGYYEVLDSTSGDLMGTGLMGAADTDRSLKLGGAVHGQGLETDIRIFNPATAEATVNITAGANSAAVTIPARGLLQLSGVLPNFLNVTDDWTGHLSFFSYTPIEVTARTSTTEAGGGLFGELHGADASASLYDQGSTSFIQSLDATATLLSRAGAGGAEAQLSLLDGSGTRVASATLALDANATRADAIADLFPGITVPEVASLQMDVQSGTVDAGALVRDPDTGDPAYLASEPVLPGGCTAPVIDSFTASTRSLFTPGKVSFSWSTRSADSVDVSPYGSSLPQVGTLTADVDETAVVTLTASNDCSSDTRKIAVAVGPPAPSAILGGVTSASTGGPAASPGQTIAVQFDNLADPANIDVIVLVAPDGAERPLTPEAVTTTGALAFRLPLWGDSTSPSGYRTGDIVIAAESGGKRTASLPFTILPLTYAGDPIAGFRALLDRVAASAQDAFSSLRQDPAAAAIVGAQQQAAGVIEASLRAMVDAIAANGKSTQNWGTADLLSVTVTRDHLATLLAFNDNAQNTPLPGDITGLAHQSPAKQQAAQRGANALNCLNVRIPLIAACKNLEAGHRAADPVSDFLHLADSIDKTDLQKIGVKEIQDRIRKKFAASFLGMVGKRLSGWLNVLEITCKVEPIRLDSFLVTPSSFQATLIRGEPTRLALKAQMTPDYDQKNLAKDIEKKELDRYMQELNKSAHLSAEESKAVRDFLQNLLFDFNADYDKAISDVVKGLGQLKPKDSVQVGTCDLDKFYAEKNGPKDAYDPHKSIVQAATSRADFGDMTFYYYGRRAPAQERFCVYPLVQNFLFHQNLERSNTALNITARKKCYSEPGITVTKSAPGPRAATGVSRAMSTSDFASPGYADDVYVGPTGAAVSVSASYWAGDERALAPDTRASATLDQGESMNLTMSGDLSNVTIGASKQSRTVYSATMSGYGGYQQSPPTVFAAEGYVEMSASIPPNRDGTQSFNASVTNVGGACDAYGYTILWTDADYAGHRTGDIYASNQPSVLTASGTGVTNVKMGMSFRATGSEKNSCSFKMNLEIIPNEGQ
jgi:hypothetical protein